VRRSVALPNESRGTAKPPCKSPLPLNPPRPLSTADGPRSGRFEHCRWTSIGIGLPQTACLLRTLLRLPGRFPGRSTYAPPRYGSAVLALKMPKARAICHSQRRYGQLSIGQCCLGGYAVILASLQPSITNSRLAKLGVSSQSSFESTQPFPLPHSVSQNGYTCSTCCVGIRCVHTYTVDAVSLRIYRLVQPLQA
jgi:hypothetical protein